MAYDIFISPQKVGTNSLYSQYNDLQEFGSLLSPGSTVTLTPGEYNHMTLSGVRDIAIVGQGSQEDIIVNGILIDNTCSGTITFENMYINPSTGRSGSATHGVIIPDDDCDVDVTMRFVTVGRGSHAFTSSGGNNHFKASYCDFRDTRQALIAGPISNLSFTTLSLSDAAWFISVTNNPVRQAELIACSNSSGSNANGNIVHIPADLIE